jgi:AmmeMemoRadiSam system protein B
MDWVRPPAVDGLFYPGEEGALRDTVLRLLAGVEAGTANDVRASRDQDTPPPKAVVAPHAGYVYSGSVAASAYSRLGSLKGMVTRVVLLGPAHRYPLRGLAAHSATAFQTPLGTVPLDTGSIEEARRFSQVLVLDEAHEGEHSLEVHLPFLQMVLGDFSLVPLVVGEARAEEVAEVLRTLWGGPETLIVVSSDLSHFLSYDQAAALDGLTAQAIETLEPEEIGHDQACGRIPLSGLLLLAREKCMRVERMDLRSSGDTAGPRNQVVGYGSWLLY